MIIDKNTSFISTYFDNKSGDDLKSTITPTWNTNNMLTHLKYVGIPKDTESILEVGCGCGRLLKPIFHSGIDECYGIDASQSMVDESKEYLKGTGVQIKKCSGEGDIEFQDNFFDFSFCIITFQHIPNTETVKKYISEMARVTKKDGRVMFQLLNKDLDRGYLWSYHDLDDIYAHLKSLGITEYETVNLGDWVFVRCLIP